MNDILENSEVTATSSPVSSRLDPRQTRFVAFYCEVSSKTFGNCYQSALKAGFTHETARNLTHNRPKWLSESLGKLQVMEPELLLLKLSSIINNPAEGVQTQLRAIEMMMKHYRMFGISSVTNVQLNIESVID